ncbi:hypothetical protein GALL_174160 [mine drainage metagenome]|uniref:YtkA-like domain-containing protein n=1 Tax=mine drainage metagenome TaxID=410659 RepID=A0A1J5RX92_9ZZZZ
MRVQAFVAFGLGLALLSVADGTAHADPADYRFEAVQKDVPASANTIVQLRLVQISTGKAIPNAVVFQPKMEMSMSGMAPMVTQIASGTPDGKGIYPFTADLSMTGVWMLTVSAKVQGEKATLTGAVPFTSAPNQGQMGQGQMDGMPHHH